MAMEILAKVRLYEGEHNAELARAQEKKLAELVVDHCHYWGDFYGPADTRFLARLIAHRLMDRQGCDPTHLRDAYERWVPK